MATAVCARNGAAQTNEAMPIAATVTYRLALSVIGALLVRFLFSRALLRTPSDGRAAPHAVRRNCAQSMPPRNKAHYSSHFSTVLRTPREREAVPSRWRGEARALRRKIRSGTRTEGAHLHDAQSFLHCRGRGSADRDHRGRPCSKHHPAVRAWSADASADAGAWVDIRPAWRFRLLARASDATEGQQARLSRSLRLCARPAAHYHRSKQYQHALT